jgi:hypothetical protein
VSNIAVSDAYTVYGVDGLSESVLYRYNYAANTWTSLSTPFTPSHAQDAIAASGGSLALLDTSGGIHVSTNGGSTWSTIKGTATQITGAGASMFVRNSTVGNYHVNLVVPVLTTTGGGFWECPPGSGCPAGSYHTLYATAKFGGVGGAHGMAGVTSQTSGYPES